MKSQIFVDASMDTTMGTYVGAIGVVLWTSIGQRMNSFKLPSIIRDGNRAEEYAIYKAVKWFSVQYPTEDARLVICTDSDHAIRNFEWSHTKRLLQVKPIQYELKLVKGHRQHNPTQLAQQQAHNLAIELMRNLRDKKLRDDDS